MNTNSSLTTGGITFSVAGVGAVVSWVLNGCPHPIPDIVPAMIAAALIAGGHLAANLIARYFAPKSPEPVEAPK